MILKDLLENPGNIKKPVRVIAVDPGSKESGYVSWDGQNLGLREIIPNQTFETFLKVADPNDILAIEQVTNYGTNVGRSVYDTVFWSGIFKGTFNGETILIPRPSIKLFICGLRNAKSSHVRQALIDRFGEPGKKKEPGFTYGLKDHMWSAFAVAVYFWDIVFDPRYEKQKEQEFETWTFF